jgi:UDP-glucuronate 4-epimerase
MNDYYDVSLKNKRLNNLLKYNNFNFINEDISNLNVLEKIFKDFLPSKVVNLAAQAGVRYSLKNPHDYIKSNVSGFMNILECCRHQRVEGLIYASSSSVYGGNKKSPFSIEDNVDKPISIYAATKKANELMAYSYSHLYNLRTTGLRFFTVYGPWGRPDMAMYIFADKILRGEPIEVFNHGKMKRDFTFIDDIIHGIMHSIDKNYLCEVFNLGNGKTENLMDMIHIIENSIGKKAKISFKDIQLGDVKDTLSDIDYSKKKINYNPKTTIDKGIPKFIDWFMSHQS